MVSPGKHRYQERNQVESNSSDDEWWQGGCFNQVIREDLSEEVTLELSFGTMWGKVSLEEGTVSTEALSLEVLGRA